MCLSPIYIKNSVYACGKCIECRIQKSTEWSFRCMLEASLYNDNCFLTLTYNEANLPDGASLKRMDLQKFIKRLRKHLSKEKIKIRYFGCGEYGHLGNRCHYHLIIFGWKPKDWYFFCYDKKGTPLFRSPTIEKLWTLGFSTVGDLTLKTAKYCAKYLQKDLEEGDTRLKPFICMSTKPGIGYGAIDSVWLKSDKIYFNGKFIKIPRYYLDILSKKGYEPFVDILKEKRLNRIKKDFVPVVEDFFDSDGVYLFSNDTTNFEICLKKRKERFSKYFEKCLDNRSKLC